MKTSAIFQGLMPAKINPPPIVTRCFFILCKLRRLLALLILPLAAIFAAPLSAQAAEMLFVSTNETTTGTADAYWIYYSAQATAQGLTPVDGRGYLSDPATPLPITADTKLIVAVSVYNPIDPARMADLATALSSRSDLAIVAFLDGCQTASCTGYSANLPPFVAAVNAIKPASWPTIGLGATFGVYAAPLNTTSFYQQPFANAGLTTLPGGFYTPVTGIPVDYALYTQDPLPTPAPATADDTVILLIPHAASNNGNGACLFFASDTSFSSSINLIAKTSITAALDPNGLCAQPVVGAPDLKPTLTGPGSLPPGSSASLTLTVSNVVNQADSANGQVTVTLPTGMTVVPGSLPANCTPAAGNGSFTCTLGGITRNTSNTPINFQVTTTNTFTNQPLTAEVTGVTGEVNTANNKTTLTIPAFAPSAAAIPTLNEWALMLLALAMLGMAGLSARRRG